MARRYIDAVNSVLRGGSHYVTSPFGSRTVNGRAGNHRGIDLVGGDEKAAATDYITAFESGRVTKAVGDIEGSVPSEGNSVVIEHGRGLKTYYYHLKTGTVRVKKGDLVSRGDVIAYMGNTGNSTGAHLHFGIKLNGKWGDPEPYLMGDGDGVFYRSRHLLRSLRRGDKGADVAALQRILNSVLPASLEADGSYGAKTEGAVKDFQRKNSLDADGVFGGKSWQALLFSEREREGADI